MERRGRPNESIKLRPRQYTDIYEETDGTKTKWIWDLDISENGPISIEVIGEGYEEEKREEENNDKTLPKTKRKYLNPNNGKYVGYARARALNIIE